ncbi:MAG: RluA family pseudouridine synthase [Sutterellaceae bacterium]|nr:RluA family pseudouridine synthase [Sutterellaceae bacterium]
MTTTKEKNLGDYIVSDDELAPLTINSDDASVTELEEDEEIEAQESPIQTFVLDYSQTGDRLDKVLARLMPEVSRARIQKWIETGAVDVNGVVAAGVRVKVAGGDELVVRPQAAPEDKAYAPEAGIDFEVVYQDKDIIVINKPAGLVVHPAAGHWTGTLLNGLLYEFPELARVPRAGIVHRLDKETSGLMVVARTEAAQTDLVRQLQARTVGREYWAVVLGVAPEAGFVDRAIGRDPRNPLRFCCRGGQGSKPAKTHCRLVDVAQIEGRTLSWVACRLETGRTHQIRVHLTTVGLPLLGDPLYRTNASKLPESAGIVAEFSRQALHASRLRLRHPGTGETVEWFVEPPSDMAEVMDELGFGPLDEPTDVFADYDEE